MAVCNSTVDDRDDDLFTSGGDFPGIGCVNIGSGKARFHPHGLSEIM